MTAPEFRATLKSLGITQRWLSQRLGANKSTVNRWALGELDVPQYAILALTLMQHLAALRPDDWRELTEGGGSGPVED